MALNIISPRDGSNGSAMASCWKSAHFESNFDNVELLLLCQIDTFLLASLRTSSQRPENLDQLQIIHNLLQLMMNLEIKPISISLWISARSWDLSAGLENDPMTMVCLPEETFQSKTNFNKAIPFSAWTVDNEGIWSCTMLGSFLSTGKYQILIFNVISSENWCRRSPTKLSFGRISLDDGKCFLNKQATIKSYWSLP